jgi:hypothetical protein
LAVQKHPQHELAIGVAKNGVVHPVLEECLLGAIQDGVGRAG